MIESLINAQSIAIVGASNDTTRVAGRPIVYCKSNGFKGRIYPVNPKYDTIQGLKAYPTLADLPERADIAIIALPRAAVSKAIENGKVGTYVMFSGGYAELGDEGRKAQDELVAKIHAQGSRLMGPNCLGLINRESGLVASFTGSFANLPKGPRSPVAFVTQSGAFGSYMYGRAIDQGLVVQEWAATGNEADISAVDFLCYYARHPGINVIVAQLEGVDPVKLNDALEQIDRSGKVLLVCKAGRTSAGAAAAVSHTGSMVGDDAGFDALLRGHRAIRRQSTSELLDLAQAAALGSLPAGRRVALLSVSGGSGVLMADEATELGMTLPAIPTTTHDVIMKYVEFGNPANPIDMTGQLMNTPAMLGEALESLLLSGQFDAAVTYMGQGTADPAMAPPMLEGFRATRAQTALPMFAVGMLRPEFQQGLRALNVPMYNDAVHCVRAVAALSALPAPGDLAVAENKRWNWQAAQAAPALQSRDEFGLKRYFEGCGLSVPSGRRARDGAEAARHAAAIGFPVALKLAAIGLQHKSDIGGVALNLGNAREVEEASARMKDAAAKAGVTDVQFLVERQLAKGTELIVSVRCDAIYGHLLIVGLGGVLTEVLKDVAVEALPSSDRRMEQALRQLRGFKLLQGFRGTAPVDMAKLTTGLRDISRAAVGLLQSGEFSEIELNPVIARADGLWIVDAVAYDAAGNPPANRIFNMKGETSIV